MIEEESAEETPLVSTPSMDGPVEEEAAVKFPAVEEEESKQAEGLA